MEDFKRYLQPEAEKDIQQLQDIEETNKWTLFIDATSNSKGSSLGVILKLTQGDIILM